MSIVGSVLSAKKIQMSSFQTSRVRDIEKKLNDGSLDASKAMSALRGEFKYNITDEEYRKIEKELRYNL